jgi:nucleotide-binding universal stress UspA family protein
MRVQGHGDREACPPCSAWLAHALETPLVVAHAFDPMGISVPPTRDMVAASISVEDLERAARRRAQRQLDAAAKLVSGTGVEPELLEGQPIPGLLELAASRGARLFVTGTAARVGLDRILKGSVTGELAAHAPCPVIAVPRAAALEEPGPVLAGYDGSEHGLRAARHAAALAAQLNRELVVVQVDKRGDEVARPRPRARRRVVRRRLGRAAQRTRSAASPRGQRRTRNR